ncbi:hypothetical protein Bca52824_035119 [Brassica carinata]|uniref:BAHD acyltransferase n=1 Tax=Brassica carinata TaxID=52824 RepID=A0A8X7S2T5_BRACI|nr:hypothetical protein Bca52824_035119 [Brassica carinata]
MEKMSVETIKPSSPTQQCLRTLDLSVVDYLMQPVYTYACLFYTNDPSIPREETTQKLKTSLSETLTSFYPFAGRVNGLAVDCNDEGAIFIEATLGNSTLSSFLSSPDSNEIQQTLLPLHYVPKTSEASITWPLLIVKASYFKCGGMSLGICMSHKLADAASLSAFIRVWAATARGESGTVGKPEFAGINIYPPANDALKAVEIHKPKITGVTKRFVFSGSKIEELKAKVAQPPRPTRVQCVTALLWRCVCAAASKTTTTSTKVLYQPANLRTKIPSLLSENLIGNLIFTSMTLSRKNEEIGIQETVKELRERAEELTSLVQENDGSATELGSKLLGKAFSDYSKFSNEPGYSMYAVTSWCNMPFYEANFGNGCPVWVVGNVAPRLELVTMLLDSNDFKGIEAWVTLSEEDMLSFEQNPELLAFASPNPAVIF